jgi:hypothetical protein
MRVLPIDVIFPARCCKCRRATMPERTEALPPLVLGKSLTCNPPPSRYTRSHEMNPRKGEVQCVRI